MACLSKTWPLVSVAPIPKQWLHYPGGLVALGHADPGFTFNNETSRHTCYLAPYTLMNRWVTHGEWCEFVQAGGSSDARWQFSGLCLAKSAR